MNGSTLGTQRAGEVEGLRGLTVLAFESRRAAELATLLVRYGAEVVSAPSMREVALEDNAPLLRYLEALERAEIDVVLLLTGVGVRIFVQRMAREGGASRVASALSKAVLVARGPKPVAALRELGLVPQWTVPSPHTWVQLVELLDAELPLRGKCVAVHEYGVPHLALREALTERGAKVVSVLLYRWERPESLEPLRLGIERLLCGDVQVALFTSANQVHSVFEFVEEEFADRRKDWENELRRAVIGSIGPVCSAALRERGLEPDLEASPPKMGPLVQLLARNARRIWQGKQEREAKGV